VVHSLGELRRVLVAAPAADLQLGSGLDRAARFNKPSVPESDLTDQQELVTDMSEVKIDKGCPAPAPPVRGHGVMRKRRASMLGGEMLVKGW